jgi:PleD family two-component response regulator
VKSIGLLLFNLTAFSNVRFAPMVLQKSKIEGRRNQRSNFDGEKENAFAMAEATLWIAIVDDDPAVLKALSRLLRSRSFRVQTYPSGREFLAALRGGLPACPDCRFPHA